MLGSESCAWRPSSLARDLFVPEYLFDKPSTASLTSQVLEAAHSRSGLHQSLAWLQGPPSGMTQVDPLPARMHSPDAQPVPACPMPGAQPLPPALIRQLASRVLQAPSKGRW